MAVFLTAEFARPANQPGEARLLGGAARARRGHPAAAAGCARTAAGRSQARICRLRDMLAQHRANPACAACHARFDSFGLAFEGYGPVGEARTKDLAGRPVDTTGGISRRQRGCRIRRRPGLHPRASPEGFRRESQPQTAGLRSGPLAAMLSDEPDWSSSMQTKLAANGYRFDSLGGNALSPARNS